MKNKGKIYIDYPSYVKTSNGTKCLYELINHLESNNFLVTKIRRKSTISSKIKDNFRVFSKDKLDLSVNNANSGDGKEGLSVKFEHDLDISFNSKYLIDVASQLEGENIEIYFNDTASPALIKDPSDFDSIFVIMPMKG